MTETSFFPQGWEGEKYHKTVSTTLSYSLRVHEDSHINLICAGLIYPQDPLLHLGCRKSTLS